jgi:hypothetical protein
MKAASAWKALPVLIGMCVSACGEEPTAASARLPDGDRAPQGLLAARQALTCEPDTDPPELSITDQDLFYECTGAELGNAWSIPAATAEDACEGPVPVHRYNSGDDDGDGVPGSIDPDDFGPGPDTTTEGLYYVQYLAWDSSYNIQSAFLSVYVQDTLKPVLKLNGNEFVRTQCFLPSDDPTDSDSEVDADPDPYVDLGVTAKDQCYGDLTQFVMKFGEIDKQTPGIYSVEYQVQDGAYNMADPVTRAVEVLDTLAPKLKQSPPIDLGPADGSMKSVDLSECAVAWDRCEGYLSIDQQAYNLEVSSNDPAMDAGDIQILSNSKFAVRARHNTNSSPRIYTAQYRVADGSGNFVQGMCTLHVP